MAVQHILLLLLITIHDQNLHNIHTSLSVPMDCFLPLVKVLLRSL